MEPTLNDMCVSIGRKIPIHFKVKWIGVLRQFLTIYVRYDRQFPQQEEHIIPGSEPATFRQLPNISDGIRTQLI